jgi:hypothetical protein
MNPQVVNLVLLLTLLYSAMVLQMIIFGLSEPMSTDFDFPSPTKYIDNFVASHTLMIRGLNPELEVNVAEGMLRTLFGERFPKSKIVAVHVIRERPKGENINEVSQKLEKCLMKLRECQMTNDNAIFRSALAWKKVPRFKFFPIMFTKRIHAEDYYITKKIKLQNKLLNLKKQRSKRNAGVAFITL